MKINEYQPRQAKPKVTPRVNPMQAVELIYQELDKVETYTKRIEEATAKKIELNQEDWKALVQETAKCVNVINNSINSIKTAELEEKVKEINNTFENSYKAFKTQINADFMEDVLPAFRKEAKGIKPHGWNYYLMIIAIVQSVVILALILINHMK